LLCSEQQEIIMATPQTVRPDSKGRIALGAYAKGVSSYRVHAEKDGRLILEPYKEVPAREAWLYKNNKALAMVEKGLKDAKEGKTSSRGKFSKFLQD
jgi:hypothetical protein